MNDANMAQIDAAFVKLHQDAAVTYRKTYDDIEKQLKGSGSRGLGGEIAQMEAKMLNQKILGLMDAAKQTAIARMVDCGCKQYLTQAGWTEIQQAAGLPRPELCKVQVDAVRPSEKANSGTNKNKDLEEIARQYGIAEKALAYMASAGGAGVVVSLIIPGWSLPVKVLCVAGVTVAVLGGSGAIYCGSRKNEAVSKFDHIGKAAEPKLEDDEQLDSLVKQIVDSQYQRNIKLYDEWLEKVKEELIIECDKMSTM